MNYREELLKRKRAYFSKVGEATKQDYIKAMTDDTSVAQAELDAFIELDYTMFYNTGIAVSELAEEGQVRYKKFLEAFGLEDPKGKEPAEQFYLPN